jgi:hypothetical protein
MAKQRFQRTRNMQVTHLLLLGGSRVGFGSLANLGGTANFEWFHARRPDCADTRAEDGSG